MLTFTEDEVRARLDHKAVVSAIEHAFRERYESTVMPPRAHLPLEQGVFLVMPCYDRRGRRLGMKLVAVGSSVEATYMLLDPATSRPTLIVPATYLTEVRTAATSAVATKFLARPDAKTLGIFGTGRQARAHLEIMPLARNFERVLVCGRDEAKARAFVADSRSEMQMQVASPEQCAAEADVICTCTTSITPLFDGSSLRPGTHLNLVGGFQPHTREVDSLTVKRARVFVDTFDGVLAEAGEILIPMGEGVLKREDLAADLHELVAGKKPGRASQEDITVFKSVGCALEDLAAAELLLAN